MPGQYCCVPQCKNKKGGLGFPKSQVMINKWVLAIKRIDPVTGRPWIPGRRAVVCKDHFLQSDFRESLLGERQRLKDGIVPSVFNFGKVLSPAAKRRKERVPAYIKARPNTPDVPDVSHEEIVLPSSTSAIQESENEIQSEIKCEKYDNNFNTSSCSASVQCDILSSRFSVDRFKFDARSISYYTGFDDYGHFMLFFNILGPAAYDLDYKCSSLEPRDQLFMTLMKLRQAKDDLELSILFEVSKTTVSQIFITWVNFMYYQLKEINIWPEKETVVQYMPKNFKKQFGKTRVILDATEVPIQKPSRVDAQSATFSTYKNKNTLKTMIGCTPRGLVSYVSESYGGAASDRQIIERCDLYQHAADYFEKKDSIMADRGIMVQDLFATHDIHVNTPTMLSGKHQLEPEQVVRDRRISSKRIHVERVIGLSKTFKILRKDLHHSKLNLGSEIIYICFVISNFRSAIVNRLA